MRVADGQLALPIEWPHPESHVAQFVERLASAEIPPAPKSETRIRLSMVRGRGDRRTECESYARCLDEAVRADLATPLHRESAWRCPSECGGFFEVDAGERLFEAMDGRCQSPLADAQGEDSVEFNRAPPPDRKPLREAVLAALADGSKTTLELEKLTGYARSTLSGRMADLARNGVVRRLGEERVHLRTSAKTMRWERVTDGR